MVAVFGMNHRNSTKAPCRVSKVPQRADLMRVKHIRTEIGQQFCGVADCFRISARRLAQAVHAGAEAVRLFAELTRSLNANDRNPMPYNATRLNQVEHDSLKAADVERKNAMNHMKRTTAQRRIDYDRRTRWYG
jgi:hypothetical protein